MKKKVSLVTGGCGFVGRNLIKKLNGEIWIIDDLSIGKHPDKWLDKSFKKDAKKNSYIKYTNDKKIINFVKGDVVDVFREDLSKKNIFPQFNTIFHLASIVGGRELIDGDPIMVGKDLGIDAMFFYWLTRKSRDVEKVLYASSSAAYPVVLQNFKNSLGLKENFINFKDYVGVPDMTYGWSKLTGEYLSILASKQYSIPIACVRPFSGYGEDQDFSYPIPAIAKRVAMREDPLTVWGSGKQGRDFVHIDDCVDAFFVIMKKISDGGACNIGSGKLTSFLEVLNMFKDLEGYSPRIVTLKDKPMGVASRYANISKLSSFDWRPKISNTEGFGRVLESIKKNKIKL